jgi:hypothetical protein
VPWPLVQHAHALADRQPGPWPVLMGPFENAARLVEVVASIEQQHDRSPSPLHFSTLYPFEARRNMDEALIAAGRPVFDGEWKKIKAEMKGEEFQTGE